MSTLLKTDLDPDRERLASAIIDTFETGDGDGYKKMFAPNAEVWLSYMDGAMPAEQNSDLLSVLYDQLVQELRYDDIERRQTSDGFVQQHVLTAVAKNGDVVRFGACTVVHLSEDAKLITRVEEYIDSRMTAFAQEHGFAPNAA